MVGHQRKMFMVVYLLPDHAESIYCAIHDGRTIVFVVTERIVVANTVTRPTERPDLAGPGVKPMCHHLHRSANWTKQRRRNSSGAEGNLWCDVRAVSLSTISLTWDILRGGSYLDHLVLL